MTAAPRRAQRPARADPLDLLPDPFDEDSTPESRMDACCLKISDCVFCGQDGHRYRNCPNRPKYLWPDKHYHVDPPPIA